MFAARVLRRATTRVWNARSFHASRTLSAPKNETGVFSLLYRNLFRSNATYLGFVFAGAAAGGMAFDSIGNSIFDSINSGKQFHDAVEPVFTKDPPGCEDDDEDEEEEEEEEDEE